MLLKACAGCLSIYKQKPEDELKTYSKKDLRNGLGSRETETVKIGRLDNGRYATYPMQCVLPEGVTLVGHVYPTQHGVKLQWCN